MFVTITTNCVNRIMNNENLNRNNVAEIFIQRVLTNVYKGGVNATLSILSEGPPGRKPLEDLVQLSQWFKSLDEENREQVQAVVQQAVDATVFCFLVLLDNLTGGNPIQEQISDFALYLQTYSDEKTRQKDQSLSSV